MRLPIDGGQLREAPLFKRTDRNWLAVLTLQGGFALDRAFCAKGYYVAANGEERVAYSASSLRVGACIENGADRIVAARRGKRRVEARWYGVVTRITDTYVDVEPLADAREALAYIRNAVERSTATPAPASAETQTADAMVATMRRQVEEAQRAEQLALDSVRAAGRVSEERYREAMRMRDELFLERERSQEARIVAETVATPKGAVEHLLRKLAAGWDQNLSLADVRALLTQLRQAEEWMMQAEQNRIPVAVRRAVDRD